MHWWKVDKPIASIWRVHCQQLLLTEQYIGKCPCYTLFLKLMIFVDLIKHGVVTLVGDAAHYKIDRCYYYLASSVLFSMCVCVCVGVCGCVCVCTCMHFCVCVCVCVVCIYVHIILYKSVPCCVCAYCLRTQNWQDWISVLPMHHCESSWKHASHLWHTRFICTPHAPFRTKKPHIHRCTTTMKRGTQKSNNYIVFDQISILFSHQSSFLRCDEGGFDLPCICLQARWGDSYHTQFRSVMPGPMLYMCHQPSAVNAFCLWIHHCHCSAEFAGTLMQPKSGSTGSSPHPQNVVSSTSTRQLTNVLTCE